MQRQSENRTDRILVDVGGYREKRNAALRRFAEGIVEEVKSSGTERALEPMSPADRKVIHDTVNEIDGVETRRTAGAVAVRGDLPGLTDPGSGAVDDVAPGPPGATVASGPGRKSGRSRLGHGRVGR